MHRQDSCQTFSRLLSGVLLSAGMLVPLGCVQSSDGQMAFRPFWGFEPSQHQIVAEQGNSGGLSPKFLGQPPGWSQDPFLAQDFQAPSGTAGAQLPHSEEKTLASADTVFDEPPIASAEAGEQPASLAEGNPFRLVQHQGTVSDVPSPEKAFANQGSSSVPVQKTAQATNAASQLDRLKIALSRDSKTSIPQRQPEEATEVVRQRVEAMMKTARRQIQRGEYESALRWAIAADELVRRSNLFFGPEEDPPADLVRVLQDRLQVPSTPITPPLPAAEDPALPLTPPGESQNAPTLSIEFPDSEGAADADSPNEAGVASSLPHSTQAMRQAVIAPETLTAVQRKESPLGEPLNVTIQPRVGLSQPEARRVNVNQGAAVSVEGPLESPLEPLLPQVPLAPPVVDDSKLPPFAFATNQPAPMSPVTVPPLPPPAFSAEAEAAETPFLYKETTAPAPGTVKNVDWDETDEKEQPPSGNGWVWPACLLAGLAFVGLLFLKRNRS